jgi:hypothetical protein
MELMSRWQLEFSGFTFGGAAKSKAVPLGVVPLGAFWC